MLWPLPPRRMIVTFRFNVPRLGNGSSLCKRATFQPSATRAAMYANTAGFKSLPRPMARHHRQPLNKWLNNNVLIKMAMRHHRLSMNMHRHHKQGQVRPHRESKLTGGRREQTTRTGRLALRADNNKKNVRGNAAHYSFLAFQGGETDALREFAKTTNSNGTSSMRAPSGSDFCGTAGRSFSGFAQPNQ